MKDVKGQESTEKKLTREEEFRKKIIDGMQNPTPKTRQKLIEDMLNNLIKQAHERERIKKDIITKIRKSDRRK